MSKSSKYIEVKGKVTNNTDAKVTFVKIKISILDDNGNVVNTDNTYACGDEGLEPGESTTFSCMLDKVDNADSVKADIYSYY